MGKPRYVGDVRRLIARALEAGAIQRSLFRYEWDVSGRCESPALVEIYGREYADRHTTSRRKAHLLEMTTKCRKCAQCLRERAAGWTRKSVVEFKRSPRTWFGTFTYAPGNLFKLVSLTRHRLAGGGTNYDALSEIEQFQELHKTLGDELTRYFKRVRKATRSPMRYLLVTERHKSGAPHHHVLIHEVSPENPIRKTVLKEQWSLGFTKFVLCKDERGVRYVTKYLSKAKEARIRASLRYGAGDAVSVGFAPSGEAGEPSTLKSALRKAQRDTAPPQQETAQW